MERKSFVLLVVGMVVFFLCSVASADVPDSINYQGKLTTAAGGCVNDTVQMTFSIYPDTLPGTSADWTETQMQVVVKDGIFDVLLGSVTPLPASLFDGNAKYLGVQVESDAEMRPLKPMVSVAYAFRSEFSDTAEYARAAPAMPDDDWVIDGDNIYHELGNVGIGTTSPGTYKLNVNGTGYFGAQLNIMDPNYYLQLSGSDARIIFDSGSDWFRFDRTNNAYDFIIAADKVFSAKSASQYLRGNVGIGTLSPTQKLDVAGTAQMTGFKMPTSASSGYVLTSDASGVGTWQAAGGIGGSGTANYIPKFTAPTTLGNSAIYQSGSSVGIGTTSPSYRLDIYMPSGSSESGALRIQNSNNLAGNIGIQAVVNGVGTANYGAHIKVENAVTVGYGIWANVENGGGNSNFGGYFSASGSGGNWNYGVQGAASVPGAGVNYGVSGVATNATNNYGVYGQASGGTNNWAGYFNGNLYASGNVGIGTTSPQGALDVNSTTGAFIVPRMTTTERDALSAVNGMIIYNTTTNQFNFYENGAWVTK